MTQKHVAGDFAHPASTVQAAMVPSGIGSGLPVPMRVPLVADRIATFYNHYRHMGPDQMRLTSVRCVVRGIRIHNGNVTTQGRSLQMGGPDEVEVGDVLLFHDSAFVKGKTRTFPCFHSVHHTELHEVINVPPYTICELLLRDLGSEPLHRVARYLEECRPNITVSRSGIPRKTTCRKRVRPSQSNVLTPLPSAPFHFQGTPCIYR